MTDDKCGRETAEEKRVRQQAIVDELRGMVSGMLPPIINGTWRLEWPDHFRSGVSFENLSLVHVKCTDKGGSRAHRVLATNTETGQVKLLKDRGGVLQSGAALLEDLLNEGKDLHTHAAPTFWLPPRDVPGKIQFLTFKSRDSSDREKLDLLMDIDEAHFEEMPEALSDGAEGAEVGSEDDLGEMPGSESESDQGRFVAGPRTRFFLDEPGRPPETEGDGSENGPDLPSGVEGYDTGMIGMSREDPRIQPDWDTPCEQCGQVPTLPLTGMCGPCTFGEKGTEGGNW